MTIDEITIDKMIVDKMTCSKNAYNYTIFFVSNVNFLFL
jgi:hypothetical protein